MRKARKRVLSTLLAAVLALGLMPSVAFAGEGDPSTNASALPGQGDDGIITLTENVTMPNSFVVSSGQNVVIDLAGHTLSYSGSGEAFLDVEGGSLTIQDSEGTGVVEVDGQSTSCVKVSAGATFTLKSGTLTNTSTAFEATEVITNYGKVNIEGGTVEGVTGIFIFNPVRGNEAWTEDSATCNVSGGIIKGVAATTYNGKTEYDGKSVSELNWSYGIAIFGPGFSSDGTVDNNKSVLNITGGTITAGQAIGTNASSGRYAGFTINMSGGTVNGRTGTGMYLPAIGVTNISGGEVTADQAIRICAGELNVTGGTITCTAVSDNSDLVAGGSGGTQGAIVVGKASDGYVGDIDVNVSGKAVVKNTATRDGSNIYPTIVVSDKNMAKASEQAINNPDGAPSGETFTYSGTSTSVTVNAAITGDIVKISNVTSSASTQDGGNTSLEITGGTVTGNVINQTSAGDLNVAGAEVAGNVVNGSTGAVIISNGAQVDGNVSSTRGGNVAILDSTVTGAAPNSATIVNSTVNGSPVDQGHVALINGKGYTTLAEAINKVEDHQTITLLKDIPNADGITVAEGKNFTLDFANHTYTLTGPGAGSTGTETNGFQLLQNSTITFKNGTIRIAENATKIKRIIQNYANLTLDNMQIYAENQVGGENYALSFNNGNIVFKGNTSVFTTNDNTIAFDVCKFSSYLSTIVTFDESYTGTVNGVILYDSPDARTHKLIIDGNGSFGSIETTNRLPSISVSGGTFAQNLETTGYLSDKVEYQVKHVTNDTFTYTYTKSLNDALAAARPGDSVTAVNKEEGDSYPTLTLDYNDGDTAHSTYTVASGIEITLPEPTRAGYTFQGWYDADGTKAGASYKVTANATLTARWSLIPTPVPTPEQFDVAVADVQNGAVELSAKTAKEGQKVTVTVTPDLGWELAQLTVADEDGDALELTENADGTYSFTMPAGDVTVHASFADAWENPFTDLSEDHWGYGAVRTANLLGLMKGIGGTTLFGPDDGLLREQAATVMWNLMGAGDVSRPEAPQADVDQSQWYAPYVNWAVDSKVMDGYSEDDFGVGDSLTREQFAAVVAKAVGADVDSADQAALGAFPDADGVSGWARATMAWAVEAGVLNGVGTEDGSRELQATRELTRAEMATMMVNAIEVGVLDFGA